MQKREFDRIADRWKNSEKVERAARRLLRRFLKKRDFMMILDVGCGKGVLLPVLEEFFKDARIICLDFSQEMLKSLSHHCQKIQSRAEDIPLKQGTVDLLISMNAFPHFEDKEKFIREAWWVLKEGGVLVILHSINRKRINRFHRSLKGSLRNTMMPSPRRVLSMMKKYGFKSKWYEGKYLIIIGERVENLTF